MATNDSTGYSLPYVGPPQGNPINYGAATWDPDANSGSGSGSASGSSSSSSTESSNSTYYAGNGIAAPVKPPPPAAPDLSQLQSLYEQTQRRDSIRGAMRDYDALIAATQAQGFQSASTAGSSYAQRLMQQGINPSAAGVVEAQAKIPVYKQIADLNKEKDTTRIDAVNKSQSLMAQIASTMASIRTAYSKTLADFNLQQEGYDLDLNKFNAQQKNVQEELRLKKQMQDAQIAAILAQLTTAQGGTKDITGKSGTKGYETNAGPIIPATLGGSNLMTSLYSNVLGNFNNLPAMITASPAG